MNFMNRVVIALTGPIILCAEMVLCLLSSSVRAQLMPTPKAYQDLTYASTVFGREKSFRLYLPQGYDQSARRYPVIYFFHGWGGRHFMDDNAKLEYEKLKMLVDKSQSMLVMWDGNMDEKEPRPYNVGNHEDVKYQVQMADYFPELVTHIDAYYRTLIDRNHRGIIGFSMGGFMAFYLAGKYPDKVGAAVSIAGSPEFFVGYPQNHTLYPIRYAFKNLQGVKIRLHNGDSDILTCLNEEVHQAALWEGVPMEYWKFHGGHMVDLPGETKVFEMAMRFVTDAFQRKIPDPIRWTHADLYPNFDVWGFHVESTKQEPGFISLKNVDKHGFGIYTHRWLPDGPLLPNVDIRITTAPIYDPLMVYHIVEHTSDSLIQSMREVRSDSTGRLTVDVDSRGTEIGIFQNEDPPEFVLLDCRSEDKSRFMTAGKNNRLAFRLFNRGGENSLPQEIRIAVRSNDSAVTLRESIIRIKALPGQRVLHLPPLDVACSKQPPLHAEPSGVKLALSITVNKNIIEDEVSIPVRFKVPSFTRLTIDDGVAVRDRSWGHGNADGIADAGEHVMVYEGDHRLRLYTEDPWVVQADEQLADEVIPARWPDGYTTSSVMHIAPDCPDGHQIECLASYETKSFNPIERKVLWGNAVITVRRK